ncbi:MAG: TRAP transporter substrate-binding protein [Candidatus Hodarchaeota archaeon]
MKRMTGLIVGLFVVIGLIFGGGICEAQGNKVFNLKMATQHPAEAPMNKIINQAWFKWLEKESNGRIKVTLLPAEQAAKADKLYDAARSGIVDIACHNFGTTPGRTPLMSVMELPFMVTFPGSRSYALTCMELYEKYPEIRAEFKGVKVLNFHSADAGQFHTVGKPIRTVQDIEGMILLSISKWASESVKLLGGTPEAAHPAEIYDLLAKKVVDGMILNWEGAHLVFHITDSTNYATEINLCESPFVHVMNQKTWDSLPPDLQELFMGENAWRLAELFAYDYDKTNLMAKDELDKVLQKRGYPGVYVFPEEEKAKAMKMIEPIYEQWMTQAAATVGGDKAKAILQDVREFAKKHRYETTPFDKCERTLHEWGASGY